MNRHLRCRTLSAAAAVVAALLLAGCGGTTTVTVADAPMPVARAQAPADPKPTPTRTPVPFQVLGGKITVEPTITADPVTLPPRTRISDPVCPPAKPVPEGVDFEYLENPELNAAINEVSERYVARKMLADLGDKGPGRQVDLRRSPHIEPAPADAAPAESADVLSQVGRLIPPAKPYRG